MIIKACRCGVYDNINLNNKNPPSRNVYLFLFDICGEDMKRQESTQVTLNFNQM